MSVHSIARPQTVTTIFLLVFALALAVMEFAPALTASSLTVRAERSALSGRDFRIIDGDTVALNGERIRISNIDTPETGRRAGCSSERRLARTATRRARSHFQNAHVVHLRRSGTDRYGRTLARIRLDGRDFGRLMIADGVAAPWRGRQHDWCG